MLVNHKFQFFQIFLEVYFYRTISFLLLFYHLPVYYIYVFLINCFAGWRYAGRIFNAGICRGKAISEFRKPEGPPPAPPPSWARKQFFVVVCAALLTFVCMLRYSEWNIVPIWFLYSSIFIVVRSADLVPGFFGTYSGTLRRSRSWILRYLQWYTTPISFLDFFDIYRGIFYTSPTLQDRTPSPLPSPVPFFSCRLEVSARGRWHRAGLLRRRGDYYLGCGRRRYCGRVCCLSRRRVLTLPQCFQPSHGALVVSPDGVPARTDATFLQRPSIPPTKQKSPGVQQIQHCQTPEQKEQMSSGYSQSTSLLTHNRITAPQLIAFRTPARNLLDPVKPQSLPIHCIRLTPRNISFIIQRTIITSQMPLHNIRIPHN